MKVPVIIPSYEPDERFIDLLLTLIKEDVYIVVVDDGSGEEYKHIFNRVKDIINDKGIVLKHDINRGKGRALKTAFKYVLDNIPEAIGVVTADSDGQHTSDCIKSIAYSLIDHPDSLILGVRRFDGEDVPWKSKFGNTLTLKVLEMVSGLKISDTQTGLRGIPREFMEELLDVEGERFEFETRMLLETVNKYDIVEVPINTIYDSKDNHQTHFNPFKDSLKIYKILFEKFLKYTFVSISSFAIDVFLFSLLCIALKGWNEVFYPTISTVVARIISATYNYTMNYRYVFNSKKNRIVSASKYIALAFIQMGCSAAFVTFGVWTFSGVNETIIKMIVDTILFIASYQIQKNFIF